MDEAKRREIRQWLIKSQRDVGSARRLMEGPEPYLDTAVYHCQQAAEKALKAFLTAYDIAFEKTHNLIALLALCTPFEPVFAHWEESAAMLTPYATEFRYPGELLEPERSEAEQALAAAEAFVQFIERLLHDAIEP
jgi:HEPN domain-containing protein